MSTARMVLLHIALSLLFAVVLIISAEAERVRHAEPFVYSPILWIEAPGIIFGFALLARGGGILAANTGGSVPEIAFNILFYAVIIFACLRSIFGGDPLRAGYVMRLRQSWLVRLGVAALLTSAGLSALAPSLMRWFRFDDSEPSIATADFIRVPIDLAAFVGALLTTAGLIVVVGRRFRGGWARRAIRGVPPR